MALEFSNLEIVLALLTKVITLHMQITIVEFGVSGFERPVKFVSSFTSWCLVSDSLNISLYKLLEEVIV